MTYTIGKTFHFSAAHAVEHLADGNPCRRVHGHNYTVTVILSGDALAISGFLVDFAEIKQFGEWLDTQVDHRFLNDVLGGSEWVTSERLAQYFYLHCQQTYPWGHLVESIRVSEGPSMWAEYREDQ